MVVSPQNTIQPGGLSDYAGGISASGVLELWGRFSTSDLHCGACTVLVQGKPVKSRMVLAVEVEGDDIRTIEGLSAPPIQESFLEEAGFQCGFCPPGFVLNAHALLTSEPNPNDNKIRLWLESHLCHYTGYEGIQRAVKLATHNTSDRLSSSGSAC